MDLEFYPFEAMTIGFIWKFTRENKALQDRHYETIFRNQKVFRTLWSVGWRTRAIQDWNYLRSIYFKACAMKKKPTEFEKEKARVLADPRVQAIITEKLESGRKLLVSGALENILNKKSR